VGVAGGLFHWGVPLCVGLARRWRPEDAASIARRLDGALGGDGRVLDLGGGTGHLAALLAAELDRPVTVLDASAPMLRQAAQLRGVEPVLGDAARMPFDAAAFGAVVIFDAVHHFARPDAALAEVARVLRPGGALVVGEFDPSSRPIRVLAAAERLLGEPGHFFSPRELESLVARHGVNGSSEARRWGSYLFVGRKDGRG
jgi:demethylmenaquinone methyltransferase/2-methoxy-6-polyprenyl-1,4-benzoquinol methylase